METNETNVNNETNDKVSINPNDYKVFMNMIKEMDDSYNVLRRSTVFKLHENGLDESVLEGVLPYDVDHLDEVSADEMRKVLIDNSVPDGFSSITVDDDTVRKIFTDVKNNSLILIKSKMEIEKTKSESADVLKDYFNYLSSDRVRKSRLDRLNILKEAAEKEPDESPEKNSILRMIHSIESSLNFSFVQDRFDSYGEKEVNSIVDGFLNEKKGQYIVNKYNAKITKFGYNKGVINTFMNIEENFLNDEYSPFNNLFLFWYMKFVAYADPYSKEDFMYVQSLTSAMANLVYHKFDSEADEIAFIGVISNVDNHFFNFAERFKVENNSYKGHPDRVAAEKEHEAHRRAALIKSLHRLNVNDFDENMDIDDMQKLYSDTVETYIDSQVINKKKNEEIQNESVENESTEDVVTSDVTE